MNRRAVLVFSLVALGLVGVTGYEARVASRQHVELARLQRAATELGAEFARLDRAHQTTLQDLAAAEGQLAALPVGNKSAVSPARRADMKAWLARVKELQRLCAAHPEQRIPEMAFLTEQDWLRLARSAEFDSDPGKRRAFAAVREAAVVRFMPQLSSALRKFIKATPTDGATVLAIAPFFAAPVDPGLLDRYTLDRTTDSRNVPQWRVREKSAIDPDYDSRHYVSAYADGRGYGSGASSAPVAWIENFSAQQEAAYRAYAAANKGTVPTGISDLLPYFNPPLDPTLAEKIAQAERTRQR